MDRALLRRPVADLAADVRAGRLSARELVGESLAVIEATDSALGAFVCVDLERAMADAAAVDERIAAGVAPGPLAGIPLGVKDTEDAAGFPTTVGSATRRAAAPATGDSILVARLKSAGAVVVGKTNTPEQAWKADTTNGWGGATTNPWGEGRTAGGSSGGSAAAVAGGLVPIATASDGGGSIRIPAAVCGLTGFKPSLGRIPAGGPTAPGWLDLSSKGVLTRRLVDALPALDAAVAPDPTDLRSLPQPEVPWSRSVGDPGVPLRVAWSPTLGYAKPDPEVLATCERAVALLAELGAEVDEVPAVFDEDPGLAWFTIVAACNERTLNPLRGTDRWELVDAGLARTADYGCTVAGADVIRALDTAHELNLRLVEIFRRCSLLLTPTVAGPTPEVGSEDPTWVQFTYPFNLTRSPAGTVCAGFATDGMPIGLQVVGPQHADVTVLRLLALLESTLDLDTVPPAYR
jgi:aspartyl-tRNA(Asn)/glutamyl-tRNA(Gln) amidotransferase subunit A